MSDWLKKSTLLLLSFAASCIPLLASSNVSTHNSARKDYNSKASIGEKTSLKADVSDFSEYEATYSFSNIAKTTLKSLQKLPWKTLTLLLALQNSIVPSTEALSVTNLNQTLYYEIDGPAIAFLPFDITTSSARVGFSIGLNVDAGIVSTTASQPLIMSGSRAWRATANKSDIEELAEKLFFTPMRGFKDIVIVYPAFSEGSLPFDTASGTVTINPVSSLPSTTISSKTTTKPPTSQQTLSTTSQNQNPSDTSIDSKTLPRTQSGLTTTSENSAATTLDFSQTTDEELTSSLQTVGMDTSHSLVLDPSKTLFLMPDTSSSQNPPYAIIGGVVGGAIVLIVVLAGAVLYKLHQKRNHGSFDAIKMNTLPIAPVNGDAGKTIDRGAIQYDVLPEGALANPQYEILPQNPIVAPNQYDVVKTPHNQYDDVDTPLNL